MAEEKDNLESKGILFFTGDVESESCAKVIEAIIRANIEQKSDFLQMMISSPGGDVNAGFGLIDIMNWSQIPVYTTGFGLVASMGLSILMAGAPGHRVITPRASMMSHRFWKLSGDNYSGLLAQRKIEDLTHQRIVEHYIACTKLKTKEEVESKLLKDVDFWITPQEAVDFGIIDQVHETNRKAA